MHFNPTFTARKSEQHARQRCAACGLSDNNHRYEFQEFEPIPVPYDAASVQQIAQFIEA